MTFCGYVSLTLQAVSETIQAEQDSIPSAEYSVIGNLTNPSVLVGSVVDPMKFTWRSLVSMTGITPCQEGAWASLMIFIPLVMERHLVIGRVCNNAMQCQLQDRGDDFEQLMVNPHKIPQNSNLMTVGAPSGELIACLQSPLFARPS